jgi:ferric-dicitrate binding protein FerR (iron transport regulator)
MNVKDDNLATMFSRFLNHDLSEAEQAELARLLASSPEAKAQWASFMRLEGSMHYLVKNGVLSAGTVRGQGKVRARKVISWRWISLAAGVALIAGAYWAFHAQLPAAPQVIAILVSSSEDVSVLPDGASIPLKAVVGIDIKSGDTFSIPPSGKAVLSYRGEATTVEMQSGTELKVWQDVQGKRCHLARGAIVCDVAKQPEGKPMVLTTPYATAEVVGTKFILSVTKELTRLEVEEGKVRLTRRADGEAALVTAHEYSLADSQAATRMVAHPAGVAGLLPIPTNAELAATTLEDGEIIFQDDFENGLENWELWVQEKGTENAFNRVLEGTEKYARIVDTKRGQQDVKAARLKVLGSEIYLVLKKPVLERWFAMEILAHYVGKDTPIPIVGSALFEPFCKGPLKELIPHVTGQRPLPQEERTTSWWSLRRDYVCGKDSTGAAALDVIREHWGFNKATRRSRAIFMERPGLSIGLTGLEVDVGHVVIRRLLPKAK